MKKIAYTFGEIGYGWRPQTSRVKNFAIHKLYQNGEAAWGEEKRS